jgi:hypothetical protein
MSKFEPINIKNVLDGYPDLQNILLFHDTDRDGLFELDELTVIYGDIITSQYQASLYDGIEGKNYAAVMPLFEKMDKQRRADGRTRIDRFGGISRSTYANEEVREYYQTNALTKLEKKFDIDIRVQTESEIPSAEEIDILDGALSRIRALRSEHFETHLKVIRLIQRFKRERFGGKAIQADANKLSSIEMYNPFGPLFENATPGRWYYAADFSLVMDDPDPMRYIFYTLLHELAHLVVDSEDTQLYSSLLDSKSEKAETMLHDDGVRLIDHEVFAEDYRLFTLTGGVATHYSDGTQISHYDERLAHFRKKYPNNL